MARNRKDKTHTSAASASLVEIPEQDDVTGRDSYRVKLEIFEGPLDLLLYLIKKDEIDIYDIPISHITEQYLEYLRLIKQLDIAVAGDFLVMASTLIYIKSKMLLPPDPKIEGEEDLNEDPRAELVERLLEYQKFKSAANMLYSSGEIERACYTRGAIETDKSNPEVSATLFDLLRVFREVLKRAESVVEMEIHRDEITMAEKLEQINALLAEREEINVRELFEMARTKRELILTFLAFLELVKEMRVSLAQRELFGEIYARKRIAPPAPAENETNGDVSSSAAENTIEKEGTDELL
ncbi:MAG: segregation/condensation protein A [Acidobacteria bacterium]|nr:segregation/condensation protein A [Acidobacteriota bacterium]MCI0663450.1 segregation/condensation protein A [Acidobacteriota bacterium]